MTVWLFCIAALGSFRGLLGLGIGVLVCFLSASATTPLFKTWNTESGLPQNSINSIAQTQDGYIWLATRDGLARFDGVRFKIFQKANTPELPNNRLWSLFADAAGRLWIFAENSDQLVVYEKGSFRNFRRGVDFDFTGVPEHWSEGEAAVFTNHLTDFVYSEGKFSQRAAVVRKREFGVDPNDPPSLWLNDGSQYFRIRYGKVQAYPGGTENPLSIGNAVQLSPSLDPSNLILTGFGPNTGYAKVNGAFWFFYPENGRATLMRFRNGLLKASRITKTETMHVVGDRSGNLWIAGLYNGLTRIDAADMDSDDISGLKQQVFNTKNGLASDSVLALFLDREENVWIGGYKGLQLIKDDPVVRLITSKDGLPSDNIYGVVETADGSIWFGAWPDHAVQFRNGSITTYPLDLVTAFDIDRAGRLWIGYNNHIQVSGESGFELLKGPGIDTTTANGFGAGEIAFVSEDRRGNTWIGGNLGVRVYSNGAIRRYTSADGLPSEAAVAFLETRDGTIWIGTTGGLARFDGERFAAFTKNDGLKGEFIRSLYEDSDGTIWIGTYDSGVTRYRNGTFKTISKDGGLFSNGVFCILEDDEGWFWMNSSQGIYRARRQDLNDHADGRITTVTSAAYGPEDGLLNVEGNGGKQPAGLRSSDGRLWFPTAGGLAVIDPKRVHRDERAPEVLIEEIKIDQNEIADSQGEIVLAPGQTALEINYTGISFGNAERLRFRYRLEGLEEAWTEAGTRRTAYFSHLPYGEYLFRVLAANRDGVWNEQGAAIRVVVDPPYYRTYWFYALASLLFAGIVGMIYYVRVSQLRTINEARELYTRQLLESQEQERSRIAMELHDSLGQSLVVIRNRALLGLTKHDDQDAMFDQLQEISDASAVALQETREIAHTLHPYQIEALGLATALHSLVDKFEGASDIIFKVEIEQTRSDLSADTAITIYRIAQEWLTNIIKHSSAANVSISLLHVVGGLELQIADDGRGFDQQTVKKGLGLNGIEERARMIGAVLTIVSAPGDGSSLKLVTT